MNDVCVIIPIYKDSFSEIEKYSFDRNLQVLANRDIFLIGPASLKPYLISLTRDLNNVHFKIFDDEYFGKIRSGTRLLMSIGFYDCFVDYKFMFICHFDAILFKDELDYWVSQEIDIIGAPLFHTNRNSINDLRMGTNGGLCLRNINSCRRVLLDIRKTYFNISTLWKMERNIFWKLFRVLRDGLFFNYKIHRLRPVLNEDMFWSVVVPDRFDWFKNAKFEDAMFFAFEMNSKLLFEKNNNSYPFGIHAWYKYDKKFVIDLIDNYSKENCMNKNNESLMYYPFQEIPK